jgi:acyl phosphate:glycerol-3-phosphate acyltransferase
MAMPSWIWFIVLALVCGSLPFGLLIARAHGIDIRQHGSKNIGATNVWRILGRKAGITCFVLDALKGLLPTLAAGVWHGLLSASTAEPTALQSWWWAGVLAAGILGHMFSPWVGFRGGKGVATGLGAMLGIWPALTLPGLASLAIWIVVFKAWRYVSLASILAAGALPMLVIVMALIRGDLRATWPLAVVTGTLAVVVIIRHRSNIQRLRAGTEPRAGGPAQR